MSQAPGGLLLIRHGESQSVVRLASETVLPDPENPLTERGRAQAEALAEHLTARFPNLTVIGSPLLRARETAATLAASLGVAVTIDERLAERRLDRPPGTTTGDCAMMQLMTARAPERPLDFGESMAEHRARAAATLAEITPRCERGEMIALVCHGGTIEHLLALALGLPLAATPLAYVRCETARYHLLYREEIFSGWRTWRLDGVNLGSRSGAG